MVAASASGCRSYHRASLETRLIQGLLAEAEIPLTVEQVHRRFMDEVPTAPAVSTCSFCRVSTSPRDEGEVHCFRVGETDGCVEVQPTPAGTSRVTPSRSLPPTDRMAQLIWLTLDPRAASRAAANTSGDVLDELAAVEEQRFTPRFSPLAAARGGVVVATEDALDPNNVVALAVGGLLGVRYWLSHAMIIGVGLDGEGIYRGEDRFFVAGVHLRAEVSLWEPVNERVLNLPGLSLAMSVTPLVAAGGPTPAYGVKAAIGLNVTHLKGNFFIPFQVEAGFQWLRTNPPVVGPRLGIGLAL